MGAPGYKAPPSRDDILIVVVVTFTIIIFIILVVILSIVVIPEVRFPPLIRRGTRLSSTNLRTSFGSILFMITL
jgi:hypothetical protein